MATSFVLWISQELEKLLGIDAEDVQIISSYIASIRLQEDLLSYAKELLSGSEYTPDSELDGQKREFLRELVLRWEKVRIPENVIAYKKEADNVASKPGKNELSRFIAKRDGNPFDMDKLKQGLDFDMKKSKKTNYVSLYGKDGKMRTRSVMLPGRNSCECQAQKHKLISNCLSCGRVVCEQEGSGPCLFCGSLVCTREERNILSRNSNQSEKLHRKLMSVPGPDDVSRTDDIAISRALEKARAYKDRLLSYDRTSAQRTRVIDDESDYFAADTNIWLGEQERELLKKKEAEMWEIRHGSRRNKKVTLDFAGRRVVEEDASVYAQVNNEEILAARAADNQRSFQNANDYSGLVNPTVKGPKPKFVLSDTEVEVAEESQQKKPQKERLSAATFNRVQDKQLLEMSDPGMCLSMHQPWASLLVRGIKRDEGRTWYSEHRGRLWIAAAAKPPENDEVLAIESQHRNFWEAQQQEEDMPPFPDAYPTGCLLGCVDVVDVMSQDEYTQAYPAGESGSPYVFVCQNPRELVIKFPVKGKHKLWKLDSDVHRAAKRSLKI